MQPHALLTFPPSFSVSPPEQNNHTKTNPGPPQLPPPTTADINAYISIFLPTTSTPAALRSFASNARKSSIRALVSANLTSRCHLSPSLACLSTVPKTTCAPLNPYFSFWSYTCNTLAWCGPTPFPNLTPHKSHPILPILMHHFACAVPSHESLTLLTRLATGRTIVDIGSGTGYWTFMLRQYGATCVAIDNGQSAWRTMWVDDTVPAEGTQWLGRHENRGGEDMLVLVVYPIVGGGLAGGTEGGFMRGLMRACNANTIAVVGTQNRNGYTAFRDMTVDEFMEKEHGNCWEKAVQVPLPSFAGKDEALFVFQKRECLFAP